MEPRGKPRGSYLIRHYPAPQSSRSGFKLLIKPSQDSIQRRQRTLNGFWRTPVGSPTVALINAMNPVIRGWLQYFHRPKVLRNSSWGTHVRT
jgi:hypothetical protein